MGSQRPTIRRWVVWAGFTFGVASIVLAVLDWWLELTWVVEFWRILLVEAGVGVSLGIGGYLATQQVRRETYDAAQNISSPVIDRLTGYVQRELDCWPDYSLWRREYTVHDAGDTDLVYFHTFTATGSVPLPLEVIRITGSGLEQRELDALLVQVEDAELGGSAGPIEFIKKWVTPGELWIGVYFAQPLRPGSGPHSVRLSLAWPGFFRNLTKNKPGDIIFVTTAPLVPARLEYQVVLDESFERSTPLAIEYLPENEDPPVMDEPSQKHIANAWLVEGALDNPPTDKTFGIRLCP